MRSARLATQIRGLQEHLQRLGVSSSQVCRHGLRLHEVARAQRLLWSDLPRAGYTCWVPPLSPANVAVHCAIKCLARPLIHGHASVFEAFEKNVTQIVRAGELAPRFFYDLFVLYTLSCSMSGSWLRISGKVGPFCERTRGKFFTIQHNVFFDGGCMFRCQLRNVFWIFDHTFPTCRRIRTLRSILS